MTHHGSKFILAASLLACLPAGLVAQQQAVPSTATAIDPKTVPPAHVPQTAAGQAAQQAGKGDKGVAKADATADAGDGDDASAKPKGGPGGGGPGGMGGGRRGGRGGGGGEGGGGEATKSIYDFSLPSEDGKAIPMSDFKGKALLIVNLGRKSSYADQLAGLEKLQEQFKDKGLVVIGVPSDEFGDAEPGTDAEITKAYADAKVNFTVTQKSELTGVHALPLFDFITKEKVQDNGLHWNYTKWLVDKKGKVLVRMGPDVTPDSLEMQATVQEVIDGTYKPPTGAAAPGGRRGGGMMAMDAGDAMMN